MKITFYPKNEMVKNVIAPPKIVNIPKWFKDISNYSIGSELDVVNGSTNYSVKSCLPFIDTFSTGYVFELWCDIQIKNIDGNPRITWGNTINDLTPVESRYDAFLPIYENFHPFTFSWKSHWGIKTPKGYSCLFTHPLNRTDLPFITTSGIMDTDGWGVWGNQPFALKKDWEGVLEAGTPIIQFIPFKREKWESEVDESLELGKSAYYENLKKSSKFRGYYKNKYWHRKEYK